MNPSHARRLRTDYAQRFFDLSDDLILSFTPDGRIDDVNPAAERILGYAPGELCGRPWVELTHPEDVQASLEASLRTREGFVEGFECRWLTRSGNARHLTWSAVPVGDRVFAIGRDVTADRMREEELEHARHLLAEAEELAGSGSWEWALDTRTVTWSPGLRRLVGAGPTHPAGEGLHAEWVHPEDYPGWLANLHRGMREGQPFEHRFRVRTLTGEEIVVHERAEVEVGPDGRAVRLHGIVQDVTEQTEITRRLRRMTRAAVEINAAVTVEDALDATTAAARDVIGAHQVLTSLTGERAPAQRLCSRWLSHKYEGWRDHDPEPGATGIHRLIAEHQMAIRLTQDELEAHPAWDGAAEDADRHPPLRGWLAAPLVSKHGETLGMVQLSDRLAGEFTADDEQLLVQLAQIASTALERLDLEERFLQAQRVEAVGRLAAGIIHDFNNTLAVMLVRSELLQATVDDPAVVEHAAELQAAARAAADVARDLLALSRTDGTAEPAPARQEPADTCEVVAEVARLVSPMLGDRVRLDVELSPERLPTLLGKGDLHQVLMNLLLNARDAVGEGGTITVAVRPAGDHIVVRVRDDGVGMDDETRSRIFTPYFTTKADRGGTGLGLAGVHTIVTRAGGRVEVDSAPGAGATFEIHIPHAERATALVPAAAGRALPGGDEPVAILGRNRSVVAVIEALLGSLGYAIAPSRPGRDPDLEGADLVVVEDPEPTAEPAGVPPGAAVLYVVGPQGGSPPGVPGDNLLHRPVSADELARKVRQILDQRRPRNRMPAHRA